VQAAAPFLDSKVDIMRKGQKMNQTTIHFPISYSKGIRMAPYCKNFQIISPIILGVIRRNSRIKFKKKYPNTNLSQGKDCVGKLKG
jgi:hypothetical protein